MTFVAGCCCIPFCFSTARGQSLPATSRSQLDAPDAQRQLDVANREATLDPASPWYLNPASFLKWGPVTARPHLNTRFTYGNSLRTRSGGSENTVVEEISPGSLFELGSKWRLNYTPTLRSYSSREFKDSLDHSVALSGGTTYKDWSFGLIQSYSSTSQPLIETGRQTDQETFGTALSASHHFNSKLLLELGVNQNFNSAEEFTSSRTWSTMDWLNYQIAPRLSIAGGIGGGYQDVSVGSNMAYEQLQARVDARIAQKLTLTINGGGEVRHILDSGGDPLINPIYGASIQYRVFEFTTLSLSGSRMVQASLLQNQVTESTTISAAVQQRLLGLLFLTVSGGFSNNRYIVSDETLALSREDDTATVAARLSYNFMERGVVGVFYNYSDNSSTSNFAYSSSQVGLELGYAF